MDYQKFLAHKARTIQAIGPEPGKVNSILFPFQRQIVRWAIRKGRAAVFADTGLGKTFIQLEWARQIGERVLIVAPLAVAEQTINEAKKLDMSVKKIARPEDGDGIFITNYQKLHHFIGVEYDAIVLDESSCLKHIDSKTRTLLVNEFTHIQYRLCCTATPAPNDIAEMGNHAQFLGVMRDAEMKAMFFVHDPPQWRLKGHAQEKFYEWLASWCVYVRKPSDIGFEDDGFILPPLNVQDHVVETDYNPTGGFLPMPSEGIQGRHKTRKNTIAERVNATYDLITETDEQWLVWCGLNDEGRKLKKELGENAVLIEGSDSEENKIKRVHRWLAGEVQTLISKPSIFGFGMNFQQCHNIAFLGLGDSWEQYYQAIRRCWRFGQKHPVNVYVVITQADTAVAKNIERKDKQARKMAEEVISLMGDLEKQELANSGKRKIGKAPRASKSDAEGRWKLLCGDSVERIKEIEDDSVGLTIFSPPFAALYTYTDMEHDMGNSRDYEEFFNHFRFLIPELIRVSMPGRRACVHVQQIATKKAVDGVIGWIDFRADVVREFVEAGWIYDGEIVLDRNPQAQAVRTKSKALLFAQLHRDSVWSRPAMADYILLFRAPGENPEPIHPDIDNNTWIKWAHPVWYGIRESDTLHVAEAREEKDERHIAPLQLGTIERCIHLWSNQGDVVFDPFAGIGSTCYEAVKLGRRGIGIELKKSYWKAAVKNMKAACQPTLLESSELYGE